MRPKQNVDSCPVGSNSSTVAPVSAFVFNPSKPVRTRDGKAVRVIATDRKGQYSIVALVGPTEEIHTYRADGRYWTALGDSSFDLLNIPETQRAIGNNLQAVVSPSLCGDKYIAVSISGQKYSPILSFNAPAALALVEFFREHGFLEGEV